MELAAWDEPTTIGVIKASVASKYLHLIQDKTTLREVWAAIFKYKYPQNEYLRYLNQLSNTHQNSLLTIKEYYNRIEELCLKLGICLNWNDELRKLKVKEAFLNGLSKRCQLEMASLNIHDCPSIYAVINTTEETMIEQIKSAKMSSRRSLKQNEINQRTQQSNHKAKKRCIATTTKYQHMTQLNAVPRNRQLKRYKTLKQTERVSDVRYEINST
ncbi:hypothetical protein DMUE_3524 [Dictyocoela muelleri]|nr:hypothetical protein DMUE_3524 [Dictyocoela muelleri]